MANISIGRYTPYDTFLHRLDPRTKLVSMILIMVMIFFSYGSTWTNLIVYGVLMVLIYILMKVAHITLKQLFRQLKLIWVMMLFLFVINLFTVKEPLELFGSVSFTIPGLNWTIYYSAFINTFYIFVRLALMLSLTLILTSSTKPMDLTYALEWLLHPLKWIKVPIHVFAMTISLALRFIPTLLDETERIMKAQASRGVDFQDGKFKEKIRAIISLIIPLIASSLGRSIDLANAMIARGYDPDKKRTRYRLLKFHKGDLFSFVTVIIVFGLLLTGMILGVKII